MSLFGLSLLINSVMFFILGTIVYFRNPGKYLNRVAGFFNILSGTWTFVVFYSVVFFTEKPQVLFMAKVSHVLAIFNCYMFYYFTVVFLDIEEREKKNANALFILASFMAVIFVFFRPMFIKDMVPRYGIPFLPVAGKLYPLYMGVALILVCYSLYLMIRAYRFSTGYVKNQIKYLLIGMAFAGLGTFTITLTKLYPFGIHFVVIYGICQVYAISRYRLMDVTLIINKTLLSGIFLGALLGLLAVLNWVFSSKLDLSYPAANTLSILIICLLGMIFRNRLIEIVDYLIYRGRYAYQKVLREASRAMVFMLDLDELLKYIMKITVDSINPMRACIFIEDEAKAVYSIKAAYLVDPEVQMRCCLPRDASIVSYLKDRQFAVVKEEMRREIPDNKFVNMFRYIDKVGAEVILPLYFKGSLMGMLTLDNKLSGRIYDQSDLNILEFLANEASLAVANAKLYVGAITDGLTGLYHHKYFLQELARQVENTKRYKHPVSLLVVDIDHFKNINDKYGHQVGDFVLKEVSKFIAENVRQCDIPARYGGDEFVSILIESDIEGTKNMGERLNEKIKEMDFLPKILEKNIALKELPENNRIAITLSVGIATFVGDDNYMSGEDLFNKADMALYRAKEGGRDRVCQ